MAEPQRLLLVQLADIGDLITATPAIAALREALPHTHLTLLTTSHAAPIIEDGLVDDLITFDKRGFNGTLGLLNPANVHQIWGLRAGDYDTVVFFHRYSLRLGTLKFWLIAKASGAERIVGADNGNGWFLTESIPDGGYGAVHQAQHWLNLVGLLGADTSPQRARVAFDDGILPLAVHRGRRVILHAGSGGFSTARRWSPYKFAQVADALVEDYDAQVVIVGTEDDDGNAVAQQMQYDAVNLTGKTTLTQLADLIRSADLYIGADSGVMHLAAAVRTPTIAIFGPSNDAAWSPWSPGGVTHVIRTKPECAPCSYVGQGVGLRAGCEAKTCMRMVGAEQVFNAARDILNDKPPAPLVFPEQARDWQDRIQLLGMPIDNINYDEWIALMAQWVERGDRLYHVCTTNPEFIIMAQSDPNFRNILRRADLCVPDGVGLLWAANRVLKQPLKERVTGSDGIYRIALEAALRGWKLFLLGAAEGIAEETAQLLQAKYHGLQVVGTYAGSPSPEDEDAIVEMVNQSGADVLLVAYGAPKQDKWIARNSPRLTVNVAMGVGGSFDFVAGKVPRAPQWMQDYGLEWLYRLYKEPRRIWRMLRLPRFVFWVLVRGEN